MPLSRWSKKQVCATQIKIPPFVFVVVLFCHTTRHTESQFLDQGPNSEKQKCGVLTTDCQGSPKILLFLNTTKHCYHFCKFSKILFKPIHFFFFFYVFPQGELFHGRLGQIRPSIPKTSSLDILYLRDITEALNRILGWSLAPVNIQMIIKKQAQWMEQYRGLQRVKEE